MSRKRSRHNPQALQPNYDQLYSLGKEVNDHIPSKNWRMSFVEIGQFFGISRQAAQAECLLALGKLAYRARKSVRNEL